MKRELTQRTIERLLELYHTIEYPEFQREPTVWSITQKQLLIDSILRSFDIGSIYLVPNDENQYQCVDGRQRLNAIFSFLGVNEDGADNFFPFKTSNEVREDHQFDAANDSRYDGDAFKPFQPALLDYKVNIVLLSDYGDDEADLNLQFQRLQIAQVLNAGEKLNAMVGEMRDAVFAPKGLGELSYFTKLGTRAGRFGNQQSASQVTLNAVWYIEQKEFKRARFIDMQEFFKDNFRINRQRAGVIKDLRNCADHILNILSDATLKRVKNRALAVSILLFYFIHDRENKFAEADYKHFDEYLILVLYKLQEVAKKPIDENPGTWERLQLAITQGSVEKSAFERRHNILTDEFSAYLKRSGHH